MYFKCVIWCIAGKISLYRQTSSSYASSASFHTCEDEETDSSRNWSKNGECTVIHTTPSPNNPTITGCHPLTNVKSLAWTVPLCDSVIEDTSDRRPRGKLGCQAWSIPMCDKDDRKTAKTLSNATFLVPQGKPHLDKTFPVSHNGCSTDYQKVNRNPSFTRTNGNWHHQSSEGLLINEITPPNSNDSAGRSDFDFDPAELPSVTYYVSNNSQYNNPSPVMVLTSQLENMKM